MKFGVREICDVVLKAKAAQKIGNKIFYAGEPVIYFDTLKTSSLEGQATTVYAQGGRGNSRLIAWEGERQLTFTMEDALISPEGFMILSGAGLIEAGKNKTIYQHVTETIDVNDPLRFRVARDETNKNIINGVFAVYVENEAYLPYDKGDNFAYVMCMNNGEITTEPYIPVHVDFDEKKLVIKDDKTIERPFNEAENISLPSDFDAPYSYKDENGKIFYRVLVMDHDMYVAASDYEEDEEHKGDKVEHKYEGEDGAYDVKSIPSRLLFNAVLVDYYTARKAGAKQMEITADKFGGNYYLEASTLFRDTNGTYMPAEFIIPNCKIQSNFTFTMASSGDPSTFTFTMDAFPDYTKFDHSKKVLAAIQVIEYLGDQDLHRHSTEHEAFHNSLNW